MIHVIATIEMVPGRRQSFLKEFHALMPKVHAEAGCLEYASTVDIPTGNPRQEPVRVDVVVIIEKRRDLFALEAHLSAPHMEPYRQAVKEFVKCVPLQILRPSLEKRV